MLVLWYAQHVVLESSVHSQVLLPVLIARLANSVLLSVCQQINAKIVLQALTHRAPVLLNVNNVHQAHILV
jgi:hypothetical protein